MCLRNSDLPNIGIALYKQGCLSNYQGEFAFRKWSRFGPKTIKKGDRRAVIRELKYEVAKEGRTVVVSRVRRYEA